MPNLDSKPCFRYCLETKCDSVDYKKEGLQSNLHMWAQYDAGNTRDQLLVIIYRFDKHIDLYINKVITTGTAQSSSTTTEYPILR